ncbi:hypothetical protein OTSUT76_1591 [Orientia tsutsugamushi str. UT76]|uniref:Uncharacterized protein n=1 Tax=Orientia tsutsugamushi TaxID=784 RepID=A0A2U3R318_ORITS|nr:hypothetical protein OTSUT76_1591 [Orientia tsutsugamushi str. UT76]SPR07624.1 Uncharacterised protein [Orientia tsutsugamushi]
MLYFLFKSYLFHISFLRLLLQAAVNKLINEKIFPACSARFCDSVIELNFIRISFAVTECFLAVFSSKKKLLNIFYGNLRYLCMVERCCITLYHYIGFLPTFFMINTTIFSIFFMHLSEC